MIDIVKNVGFTITLLLLGACGGGGGSGNPSIQTTESDNPSTQTTELTVVQSVSPMSSAVSVSRSVQPMVNFNQSLIQSSVSNSSVQLLSPLGLPINADVSVNGSTLSVIPTDELPGDTNYTLRLAPTLQGLSGSSLDSGFTSSFSTEAQMWQGASRISSIMPDFELDMWERVHTVAVDLAGNVTVVWVELKDNQKVINASRYTNGVWNTPIEIANLNANVELDNFTALGDTEGNVTVLWIPRDVSRNLPFGLYSIRYNNGSWGDPVEVGDPGAQPIFGNLSAVVDAAGNVTAVWDQYDRDQPHYSVYSSRYSNGEWSAQVEIVGSPSYSFLKLGVDADGNVSLLFDAGREGIYYSRYSNDSWSSPIEIGKFPNNDKGYGNYHSSSPTFIVDRSGSVTVMWGLYFNAGGKMALSDFLGMYFSRYSNGSWSTPAQINNTASTYDKIGHTDVSLEADAAGNVTAVWSEVMTGHTTSAFYSSRYSEGSWSDPVEINSGPNDIYHYSLSLVVDSVGNVTAAWTEVLDDSRVVINSSHYSNGTWSTPLEIDDPNASGKPWLPILGVDAAGNVTAVWYQAGVNINRFQ